LGQQIVNLVASVLAVHTPLAEMFAVVREHVVAVFSESRACATHYLVSIEPPGPRATNIDGASLSELRQINFLHRTSSQPGAQSAVLHDATLTYIDSVMRVTATGRYDVNAEGRLTPGIKGAITGGRCGLASTVEL
jgi:hypothetical protein